MYYKKTEIKITLFLNLDRKNMVATKMEIYISIIKTSK